MYKLSINVDCKITVLEFFMKATMFSKEKYIPMCMASGRDALFIGYDGSNFVSHNGHAHMEAHQGAQTGWYKSASKKAHDFTQPSVMAGVQVHLYGAAVVPTSYEQEFIPEEATLYTTLTFRAGIKLRISSFFTYGDCIWGERVEILEMADEIEPEIGFRVCNPFLSERLNFLRQARCEFSEGKKNEIAYTFITGEHTGRGVLIADRDFDSFKISSSEFADQCYGEGLYKGLRAGDVLKRTMICLGDNEKHVSYDELLSRAYLGFDTLHARHKRLWADYFATASLSFGNEELDYVFKLSRYLAKACQGEDSGIVTLGMMPYHWRGAASCAWDEEMVHEAMLITGNFAESEHYTEQYKRQAPEGYRILKERGLPGVAFSGWNSLLGEFCGHRPIEEWITTFKPMFAIYAVIAVYNEWKYNPGFSADSYKEICIDVLRFLLSGLVKQGADGLYYLSDVKDGNETGVMASVDTSTTLKFAEGFLAVGEMYSIDEYTKIGQSMIKTLEGNRSENGMIMAARNSPYQSNVTEYFRRAYKLLGLDISLVDMAKESIKTAFGYDSQIGTEEKLHWPWYDSWAMRAYIVSKAPEACYEHIEHCLFGRSALGALPEFIRLDGVGIGYYYTTPHGSLISALCEAAVCQNCEGELLIGYGLGKEGLNLSAQGIWTSGKLCVGVKVVSGELLELTVENHSDKDALIALSVCPYIKSDITDKKIKIAKGESFNFTR